MQDLEFIKKTPAVVRWANEHKVSEEELDGLIRIISSGQGYIPNCKDESGDLLYLKLDMEGTVHARDDVARDGIEKILKILEGKS